MVLYSQLKGEEMEQHFLTVRELIELLKTYDPNKRVGYDEMEYGWQPITGISEPNEDEITLLGAC